MSTQQSETSPIDQSQEEAAAIKALVDSFAKSNMQDDHLDGSGKPVEKPNSSSRPMRIYTREQLLYLSNSPLVQLPPNMPELKQWFGDNELALTKKDNDLPSSGSGRERRFRREAEDSEMSSRPSFRSRDRERDTDRDRDRDARDKEGLRHLSDKYDRERMGMIPSSARGKDRETPSHLSTTSSSRANASQSSLTTRRGDPRESTKKKAGETGDDWRRNDSSRNARDDRNERTASRARDTSKSRRSPSRSQRERDDGRDRDRTSKNDRDRDDQHKRDRERDVDRDQDDDPRRWRDDGKRDERIATRRVERDRELRTRERDRGDHWEPSNDRRWAGNDDRDARYKRSSARDRKSGAPDDSKDRDERREREKEKEPAWMETYVPTPSSGILGGKSDTGELDGIQIWKKGLKEKEAALQEKNNEASQPSTPTGQEINEKGLDEIQLFKLLMKREEEKLKIEVFGEDVAPTSLVSPSESGQKVAVLHNGSMSSPASETVAGFQQLMPSSSTITLEMSESLSSLPSVQDSMPFETIPQKNITTVVTSSDISQVTEKLATESSTYNPLAGSRLLALGRSSAKSPVNTLSITHSAEPNDAIPKPGTPRTAAGFPLFNDLSRINHGEEGQLPLASQYDPGQRVFGDKSFGAVNSPSSVDVSLENANSAYASSKGSRFAKFFDNRTKENPLSGNKPQTPTGFISSSPSPLQRQEQAIHSGGIPAGANERTMEDIFAMLNNSTQLQRATPLNQPSPHQSLNNGLVLNHHANALNNLPPQPHHLQSNNRLDALYDSQLDDRSFVPDGMVPGLRTVPPPRVRDNVGLYQELPEEAFQYHVQRLQQQQQQRNPDPFVGNTVPMYGPQAVRNMGLAIHQPHYRGGPSPGSAGQNALPNLQSQRLPPGLANLGGRPPHDPSQFIGIPGHPNALSGNIHLNAPPTQQPFNNFVPANNINFNNSPLRGPIPNMPQLQNTIPHSGLGSMGLRQIPNQLLGVGGINMSDPRGAGFNSQPNNHLQGPLLGATRQQAHLPPQIPPHLMPQHFQQQGLNGPTSQQAHDLMALLMGGGPHRE